MSNTLLNIWNSPLRVIGAWLLTFFVWSRWIGTTDDMAVDAYLTAFSVGVAGIVATLVWAWMERYSAAGLMKALLFGGVLTVVGFGLLMVGAGNIEAGGTP